MRLAPFRVGALISLTAMLAASPVHAQIDGRIVRVGLFAGAMPVVRNGEWSFVEVELRNNAGAPFDGELRLDQPDRDGDIVTSVLPLALASDGEWRPYEVYFLPHERSGNVQVRLFDHEGRLVKMRDDTGTEITELESNPFSDISAEEFLIVDLTTPSKLAHVRWLDSDRRLKFDDHLNRRRVRGLSPRELPHLAQGLAAVDAIVWDDADASILHRDQIGALLSWVESGGRLLVSMGSNWQTFVDSPLADALPAKAVSAGPMNEAQGFLSIVDNDAYKNWLDRYYSKTSLMVCNLKPRPDALPIPAISDNVPFAYRRLLGRGSIVVVAAPLRQLLPPPAHLTDTGEIPLAETEPTGPEKRFLEYASERIVGRNFLGLAKEVQVGQGTLMQEPIDLFQDVRGTVAFSEFSAVYVIFAIIFAIAYSIIASGGSYLYLKRRGWQHHCWIAFAMVSIVGSVIGTGMVWMLRGFTTKLRQVAIVDCQAGTDYAYASSLFGIKTPKHSRFDLHLRAGYKEDTGSRTIGPLRPMPEATGPFARKSQYVAPASYQCVLAGAELADVKIRATLKEFMGSWHGPLGGMLDAKLVAGRKNEFGEGSYIRNNVGCTLKDCYLLTTKQDIATEPFLVNCFRIGDIPASGPGSQLDGETINRLLYFERGGNAAGSAERLKTLPLLRDTITQWRNEIGRGAATGNNLTPQRKPLRVDQEHLPLLLLSVYDLMRTDPDKPLGFRRSHGRTWSCTHQLTNRTAILIGYSEEPSPIHLQANRSDLEPDKSRTLYRFVVPVELDKER